MARGLSAARLFLPFATLRSRNPLPREEYVISTEERRRRSQRRNLLGDVSDTIYPYYSLPVAMGRCPRGERAGGEVENSNYIFLFVILSDSEGSLCPSISVFGQRCLGNARSRSVFSQLFRRAARHDNGVGEGELRVPSSGRVCHFDCSE